MRGCCFFIDPISVHNIKSYGKRKNEKKRIWGLVPAALGNALDDLHLLDQEGTHDTVADLGVGEDTSVRAGHGLGPLGGGGGVDGAHGL